MTMLERLRADAREIFLAGVRGADPAAMIHRSLEIHRDRLIVCQRGYPFSQIRNIRVTGAGKAAAPMAGAVEAILAERSSGGVVVVKNGHALPLQNIEIMEAGHPIPDQASERGARRVMDLAARCGEKDLLIFLLSGGASALLACPMPGLSLQAKQLATSALLQSGADIHEINAVRKHLSAIKGGKLARLCAPGQLICLILSDVVGDAIEDVGSGPTAPDPTTYADCLRILQRYDLEAKMPSPVAQFLARGARGEIEETLKPPDLIFERVQNVLIGSNSTALEAARQYAQEIGYQTITVTAKMQGEARRAAQDHAEYVRSVLRGAEGISRPVCLLSAGETTVTVSGSGQGGRNQEFALAAALAIEGLPDVVILSGGTDGTDGPTAAAGGIVDGTTVDRARAKGREPMLFLQENDSYHLLEAVGDLLITGPTLTNVMDLQITMIA